MRVYYAPFMFAPIIISCLQWTSEQQTLSGDLALADLSRLAGDEQCLDLSKRLVWRVSGALDAYSRPVLRLSISGEISLQCARCGDALKFPLQSDVELTLFFNEQKLEAACESDETLDAILLEGDEVDVRALIEDEILLSLPLSPVHDQCESRQDHLASSRPNPFAVLAALKTKH